MLKLKFCSIAVLLLFQMGFGQSKEEILGKKVFSYYQNHQMDSLRSLLPTYDEFMRFSIRSGKDSVKLYKTFPNRTTYDSLTWSTASTNLMGPILKAYSFGLDWGKAIIDSIHVVDRIDTFPSGFVWRHSGLVVYFNEAKEHYSLIIETTIDVGEEQKMGERVFLYQLRTGKDR